MTEEMKAMIELVNESLKEVERMSKADKMFAELGLKRCISPVFPDLIEYYGHAGVLGIVLTFDTTYKHWYTNGTVSVPLQIVINEKMKEMGWLYE